METGSTLWNKYALFNVSLWVMIEIGQNFKNLGASGKGLSGSVCVVMQHHRHLSQVARGQPVHKSAFHPMFRTFLGEREAKNHGLKKAPPPAAPPETIQNGTLGREWPNGPRKLKDVTDDR